ncbi:MAG: ornithine cyclodeaminase family protein [Desulfobacula sp.]|nr:ornithine cyclodeaminase family protein [Desulfobacula sp.]
MIFINKKDMQGIDQRIIQQAVENAYRSMLTKDYNMPDRMHVADRENMLLLMPCFSKQFFVTKLVSVFPGAYQYGKPSVNGVVVLNDNMSGQPLAIMDGAALTAQRTGAVGGVAVKMLTKQNIETAGIIGVGVQGFEQARYLLFNRRIKTLYIYTRKADAARDMGDRLVKEFKGFEYIICDQPEQLVEQSEVVIAATTSANPVFEVPAKQIYGKTFISIGSFRPDMQEFPNLVIKSCDAVFVDTLFACKESGDIANPLKQGIVNQKMIRVFADLLDNGYQVEKQTIFFKSVGMALFDLAVAIAIYQLSTNQNNGAQKIGQQVNF